MNDKLSKDGPDQIEGDLDMNNKKILNVGDTTNQDVNAINYRIFHQERSELKRLINEVGAQTCKALPLDGTKPMAGDLDMNNNKITKLSTDAADVMSAANVRYVNSAKVDLVVTLTDRFNKRINKSYISGSTNKKDVSDTSWTRSTSQQAKITSSLMVSRTFLLHLTI